MPLLYSIPALIIQLSLNDLRALLLLDVDALLARDSLHLGHEDALALGLEGGLTLLLILGLHDRLDDSVRHGAALPVGNVVALLLLLSFLNDRALLLRHLYFL